MARGALRNPGYIIWVCGCVYLCSFGGACVSLWVLWLSKEKKSQHRSWYKPLHCYFGCRLCVHRIAVVGCSTTPWSPSNIFVKNSKQSSLGRCQWTVWWRLVIGASGTSTVYWPSILLVNQSRSVNWYLFCIYIYLFLLLGLKWERNVSWGLKGCYQH